MAVNSISPLGLVAVSFAAGWLLARISAARARRKQIPTAAVAPSPEVSVQVLRALQTPPQQAQRPLAGRRALVTGAGRGIGRGAALALARLGADIILNDLPGDEAADETARVIEALGSRCDVARCDVSDAAAVERMVSAAGALDIVVASAAWSDRGAYLDEQKLPLLQKTLEVSQMGIVHTVRAAARALRARRLSAEMQGSNWRGKVVLVSSIMGVQPLSDRATAYSMAKAAVVQLGKCLAAELCPQRINVNVVLPGWIDTPGERKWTSSERMAELEPQMPWGRLGTPDDVGAVIGFLCSDAADYMTGSAVVVDGGYSVSLRLPMGATA